MIVGVDHLALSTICLKESIQYLEDIGFKTQFIENNLTNNRSKMPFLREFKPQHDIVYLKSDKSISIELTKHSRNLAGNPLQMDANVLFSGKCPGTVLNINNNMFVKKIIRGSWGKPYNYPVLDVRLDPFMTNVYWIPSYNDEENSYIKKFILEVFDFEGAIEFWTKGLGFNVLKVSETDERRWATVEFPSVVQSWKLKVLIVENEKVIDKIRYLDDTGFTSICLLTTNIEQSMKTIAQFPDTKMGEIFNLVVNRRKLCVGVGRGPNKELIELVKIDKS